MNTLHCLIVASLFLLGTWNAEVFGQVECAAPGNLRGIRIDGELMAFSTSIRAVVPTTAEEGQGARGRGGGGQFSRDGGALIVTGGPVSLTATPSLGTNLYLRASAKGVRVVSPRRQIELSFPAPVKLVIQAVRTRGNSDFEVSFPLSLGSLTNGQNVRATFTIKATGEVDKCRGMQETGRVPVVQGTVQLPLDIMSFTSLAGSP